MRVCTGVFQVSPVKALAHNSDVVTQVGNTTCRAHSISRLGKVSGRCLVARGGTLAAWAAARRPAAYKVPQPEQRKHAWGHLLSLAAMPGLKVASDSASGFHELHSTDNGLGGSGGASGNGSGPWGDGDGFSGKIPSPLSYLSPREVPWQHTMSYQKSLWQNTLQVHTLRHCCRVQ